MAESLVQDLSFFLNTRDGMTDASMRGGGTSPSVYSFFAWEVLPFDPLSPSIDVSAERLNALYSLAEGKADVLVTTVDAVMQYLVPVEILLSSVSEIKVGQPLERDELIRILDDGGYFRSAVVEECGNMAVRGAVVDFFPANSAYPIRAELLGGELRSLRTFDSGTQRSVAEISGFSIVPVSEMSLIGAKGGLKREEVLSENISRMRRRASELDIPQRSMDEVIDALSHETPWPGMEHLLALFRSESSSIWDYLPSDTVVVSYGTRSLIAAAEAFEDLVGECARRATSDGRLFPDPSLAYMGAERFTTELEARVGYAFRDTEFDCDFDSEVECEGSYDSEPAFGKAEILTPRFSSNDKLKDDLARCRAKPLPLEPLARKMKDVLSRGMLAGIVVSQVGRMDRYVELLETYGIFGEPWKGGFLACLGGHAESPALSLDRISPVYLFEGRLSSGFESTEDGFCLVADSEIFSEISQRPRSSVRQSVKRFLGSLSQLGEGDYVVHIDHGIGIYLGLREIETQGKIGDFLHIEYAGGDKLFLPVENIGRLQKYAASDTRPPKLSKLGGRAWAHAKQRVRRSIEEISGRLISLMARRELTPGVSFGEIDAEDRAFADSFPYDETPDQKQAIYEVLADMGKAKAMDRLVCGDVGYGKTEVALRAAFKAANRSMQTAVLVPTTILAEQHYLTFCERFSDYPIEVACVSRFYSQAHNRLVLERLAAGKVDVVIGTHRLLQKDVSFHRLGLLIVDEEHRFGVTHKERLKKMRLQVDVLTLTATPIPRTLHMSLAGIRDLSVIETPPMNRRAIRTYVAPYEASIVREAILRELKRSGQVFYVHNRVDNICAVADEVAELLPEARVSFAHGQMKESQLSEVMRSFLGREVDVLVTTTIIESGLDIPNANTIIVRKAEKFGLAQLYQLRGRVGRSTRRAYAYLLISDPRTLGENARKRLAVIRSVDDLGMGFRLAMQDLEIRGAGNLLGGDQSGHINAVGFELYTRILRDAVRELRLREDDGADVGDYGRVEVDPEVNIGFPAHIPVFYIPDVAERLLLYQRLVDLSGEDEAREISEEMKDRFGPMPKEVVILLESMVLRSLLRKALIVRVTWMSRVLKLAFHPSADLDVDRLLEALRTRKNIAKISPARVIDICDESLCVERPMDIYRYVGKFLEEFSKDWSSDRH